MRTTYGTLALSLAFTLSASALQMGPETPVREADCAATQESVVVSRDSTRTLIAFVETAGEGQPSRVVLHLYEAHMGVLLGRQTFGVESSARDQLRPALGNSMIAWVEEEPNGGAASLWWHGLDAYSIGSNFRPIEAAERVADVAPGTNLEVLHTHVFHVIVWTAPDGRLKGVYRSLVARIGYDPSPFYVTEEAALHPAAGITWSSDVPLIAYNYEVPSDVCSGCTRYAIRATVLGGPQSGPQSTIDIAPAGASAPKVVFNGTDFVVFWSMEEGGTFAQRMSTAGGAPVKIGEPQKVYSGSLEDASLGKDHQYLLAVKRGSRLSLLRLDPNLTRLESIPFQAQLTDDMAVSLSGDPNTLPMVTYAAQRPGNCAASQALLRLVDDFGPGRRRSVR